MTRETFTVHTELVTETCCQCGMLYAMTREFYKDRQERRRGDCTFYCPRGHPQYYTGESEAQKLRRERDRLLQNEAYLQDQLKVARNKADHERNRANGYKGHATRITKRAKAGVCPCCNRTFKQLAAHMASQHPTFTPLDIEQGVTVQ